MEFLEQEIVRLLKDGPTHAGTIRNKLNGFPFGLDVSQDEVLRVLRQLEATYVVEMHVEKNLFLLLDGP